MKRYREEIYMYAEIVFTFLQKSGIDLDLRDCKTSTDINLDKAFKIPGLMIEINDGKPFYSFIYREYITFQQAKK